MRAEAQNRTKLLRNARLGAKIGPKYYVRAPIGQNSYNAPSMLALLMQLDDRRPYRLVSRRPTASIAPRRRQSSQITAQLLSVSSKRACASRIMLSAFARALGSARAQLEL